MSGWWNRKVSLSRISPQQRQRVELLAGEQMPESEDVYEAAVLRAIIRFATAGRSPEERNRRLILALLVTKIEPWSGKEAAKLVGWTAETVSRSMPKILQAVAGLVAEELKARGRSILRSRSGL